MHKQLRLATALTFGALLASATAQVDFLYTNISSTAGQYHDCITLWNGVANRPLAQETTVRTATGSARKAHYRVVGGKSYVYWLDVIPDTSTARPIRTATACSTRRSSSCSTTSTP